MSSDLTPRLHWTCLTTSRAITNLSPLHLLVQPLFIEFQKVRRICIRSDRFRSFYLPGLCIVLPHNHSNTLEIIQYMSPRSETSP